MTAAAQISATVYCHSTTRDICVFRSAGTVSSTRFPSKFGTTFATGSRLLIQKPTYCTKSVSSSRSVSVKCEQSSEGTGVDVWLGRLAMVGFAAALTVEVGTGKGLLGNFGLTSPLPTVALGVTALVGVLTAVFIFQSSSDN